MAYMHIGKDFVPPDVPGKVTGRIKYAEDYTREGMVYSRLLTSPIPHARVLDIDASEALAMDGVFGILTADDVYPDGEPQSTGLKILTNEPTLVGEPILALAAIDEKTAETAISRINVTFERLPFVLDPLDSLVEGGANAYPAIKTHLFIGRALLRKNGLRIRLRVSGPAMNQPLNLSKPGHWVILRQASRLQSLSMKPRLRRRAIPITRWSRAAPWLIGKMASSTCMAHPSR